MQVLFAWDAHAQADEGLARQVSHDMSDDPVTRQQAVDLARATWEQREMIDQRLERHAPKWPPRRQPGVDRNLLRLAVWELTNVGTPAAILIDDVLEIAKVYSTQASGAFIHGVLDAIVKEHQALLNGLGAAASGVSPVAEVPPPVGADDHGPLPGGDDDDGPAPAAAAADQ